MPKYLPAGRMQYALNNFSNKSPPYHLTQDYVSAPLHQLEVERSPATGRSGDEVASLRCYTRRIGWDSPNHPGSGKWTSNSLAPTFCVIGLKLRTITAKPTASTVGCALVPHSVSFPGTTVNFFWRRATLASHARSGSTATAIRCSPREPTFGTRAMMGCGGLEKSV